jgi:hypothetical protein
MGNWLSDSKPDNVAPPVITSSLPVAPTVATQQQPALDFIQHLNAIGSTGVSTMEARAQKRKRPYKPVYPKNVKRPRTSKPLRSGSGVPIRAAGKTAALRNSNAIPFPVADAVEYADEIEAREEKERLEQEEEEEWNKIMAPAPVVPAGGGAGPVAGGTTPTPTTGGAPSSSTTAPSSKKKKTTTTTTTSSDPDAQSGQTFDGVPLTNRQYRQLGNFASDKDDTRMKEFLDAIRKGTY